MVKDRYRSQSFKTSDLIYFILLCHPDVGSKFHHIISPEIMASFYYFVCFAIDVLLKGILLGGHSFVLIERIGRIDEAACWY